MSNYYEVPDYSKPLAEPEEVNIPTSKFDSKAYEGFPYITFIHERVRRNLMRRENTQSRINTKTPWIKFTSGLWKTGTSINDTNFTSLSPMLSKGKSTYNYNFDDLYDKESGYMPLPGITNISVKYLSKFGGVREATVNWFTNSLEQFEKLAPYFLTPGIAALIEWGWTDEYSNYQMKNSDYSELQENPEASWVILNNRAYDSQCTYDGMHGIVKNFSFSINSSGGYDCTTTIISGGTLMYGLNLNEQSRSKEEKKDSTEQYNKSIKEFVTNHLEKYIHVNWTKEFPTTWLGDIGDFFSEALAPTKYKLDKAIEEVNRQTEYEYTSTKDVQIYNDDTESNNKKNIYVTWGFIEDIIVNKNLSIVSNSKGKEKLLYKLNSRDVGIGSKVEDGKLNNPSSRISNNEFLRTTDLHTCIIPQTEELKGLTFKLNKNNNGNEYLHGAVRHIYVHLNVVIDAFENSDFLTDALMKILNKINSACGDMWNFALKVRETDGAMCVIDENYTDTILNDILTNDMPSLYNFSTFGGNSIIKDINFDGSLPNSVAMTAVYGHHKETDDLSVVNSKNDTITSLFKSHGSEFIDKLYPKLKQVKNTEIKTEDTIKSEKKLISEISLREDDKHQEFSIKLKNYLPEDGWIIKDTNGEYAADDNITHLSAMKLKMLKNAEGDPANQLNDMIVPGDFNVKIEGMSGFRIGDIFTSDILPNVYLKNSVFQITSINHEIDTNAWDTSIVAKMRIINTNLNPSAIRKSARNYDKTVAAMVKQKTVEQLNEPDATVLKWIKDKMGPAIDAKPDDMFTTDIIAGIIHTETGGIIRRHYKNGTASPQDIVKKPDLRGDSGHAFGFYQIHTNTAKDWIEEDGKPYGTWTSVNESTKQAKKILNDKKKMVSRYIAKYNSVHSIRDSSISAYNQGQGNVHHNIKAGLPPDTGNYNNYVNKVLKAAEEYRNLA